MFRRPVCALANERGARRESECRKLRRSKEVTIETWHESDALAYLGDATIGERTNIGAGTVTCNFDGKNKHETIIEDDVKIGSDTMLVAPVRVGARSMTGAGSVVTKDVPPDSLVAGVPAEIKKRLK